MSHLSANPMYKGLLSVFQKKHTGDSIAKYANLYCMSIDSSSVLKDRELTAHMAANYNYNRYQKQALENAEKANNRLYFVVVLLSLSILGIIAAIFFYLRYRKNKKCWKCCEKNMKRHKKITVGHRTNCNSWMRSIGMC